MMRSSLFAIALALSAPAFAQETPAGDVPPKGTKADAEKPDKDVVKASVEEDAQPVRRSIPLRGKTLTYTVTPGHLTVRNDKGEPIASMFYVAYTIPSAGRARPVTFLFNGGPGSSSIWLHMGAFGPVRVVTTDAKHNPPAPYSTVNNDESLLDASDLVFIDAPGTGFSRIAGKDKEKAFYGVDQDIHAFTDFITKAMAKGWLALSIHDAFIAEASKVDELRNMMIEEYKVRLGYQPKIDPG
jgi:carboxypeptidase C (cathepsin A)